VKDMDFIFAVIIGFIAMIILGYIPIIGPIIAGIISGFLAGGGIRNGAIAGFLSGNIGFIGLTPIGDQNLFENTVKDLIPL